MIDVNTTLNQLAQAENGSSRLVAMIGAKAFIKCDIENFVSFKFMKGAKNKANYIRITLNASDTYDGTNWTIEDHAGSTDGTSSGMTQANLVQSDLSFTSGYSPYALNFDGTSNYIDCGATVQQPTTNYSVSCWVKLDSIAGNTGIVGNFKTPSFPQVGFALTLSSGLN